MVERATVLRRDSSDTPDVIDKVVYTATNPVLDQLVARVHHWPGAKMVRAMLHQEPILATRPDFFFRDDGPMPGSVMLRFTVPEELGNTATVLGDIRERIAAVEAEQTLMREDTGRNVLGRRAVLRRSWSGSPTTFEPRRNLRPRVAARSKWSRIAALLRNHAFVKAYRAREPQC